MSRSITEVLRDKKGIVEGLGIMLIVMTLLIAVGGVVANYALLSRQAGILTTLSDEVTNRAEAYASALNANLGTPQVPSTARECSTTTQVCTQVMSANPTADGAGMTLRIQADAVVALSQSVTQDVKLFASEVTHVTAIDEDSNNVWALTDEGLRFRVWALAEGKPTEVDDDDVLNPADGNAWVTVDDRAGIDRTGALWVWGPNNIGQAGVGSASSKPVAPTRIGGSFRSVVTEDDRGYAIDADGRLWVWGKNNVGQLGIGHKNTVMKPTKVSALSNTRFTTVAIGKNNAHALTSAGDLRVAGQAQPGYTDVAGFAWRQLGPAAQYSSLAASTVDGTVVVVNDAGAIVVNGNLIPSPAGVTFTAVSKGGTAGYAISTVGDLYSWGQGPQGQLGQGATTTLTTVKKVAGAPKMVAVQGSASGALAITVTGELYYAGTIHLPYEGAGAVASSTKFVRLVPGTAFRQLAGNPGNETFAVKDKDGNLLSVGGTTAGLWPMNWLGEGNQLVRMPTPSGFASYTP